MAAKILFIPLSSEAGATVLAIMGAARAAQLTVAVIDERATDALLEQQSADVVIIKQIELASFTPSQHDLTVIAPSGSEAFVADVAHRHPDMPRSWWLIHASEGIACCIWLAENGARLTTADGFAMDGQPLDLSHMTPNKAAAPEFELYRGLMCRHHHAFDITAQTVANSPVLAPDEQGWHDLSGRAAHVVCGPYFFLPGGNWSVDVDMEVNREEGHVRLFFEWGSPAGHRTNFESIIRESGRYAVRLETDFDRPDAAHCLIATNASHLQGRLKLNSCVIKRLDHPANAGLPGWA